MERMKKKEKEIRLRTFFVRFLLKLVAAVLLAFLLWLFQITVSVGTGLILPADTAEKEALAYLHTIGAHTDIVSSGIPSACSYAIYDTSGALLETDMSDSLRENADLLALSGQDSLSANMLGRTYVKRQTDTRIVVLTYDFRSAFANPTFRRLFPSAELLEVFLLLFLLLAAFVLVITRQAKYLSRELFHLQEAADEIRNQNLDFTIRPTAIREFNQVAASLDALKSELSASLKEQWHMQQQRRRQFSALAHDIKTPLTSIINYVELLKQEDLKDPKIQRYIEVLEQKSQRLKTLTEDVVEASKVSSGNITLEFMNLNLVEMIQQTSGEFEEKFKARDLEEVMNLPNEEVVIRADGRRLWRVLSNIYNNAAKYAMQGTRVYADLEKKDGMAYFSLKNVSEQPLNISADELTERFIRGDVSRSTEGSGLGLSIAQSLTEMQGGTFELYLDGDLFKVTIKFPIS